MRVSRISLCGAAAAAALAWGQGALAQETPPPTDGIGDTPAASEPAAIEPIAPPPPAGTISDAIAGGKLILEARARYEDVDQTGIANSAQAYTIRTRLGWETAEWRSFKGLIEFEDVRLLGRENYNVAIPGPGGASLNGRTTYPIVNDPEVTELNRLQLTWNPFAALGLTVGRQRILIDDQRFVGNVGWRQDEQTFDAARADVAWGKFKVAYAYVTDVNRVLGEARDWHGDSHLVNATWSIAEQLKLQAFDYALEFDNAAANSTNTMGVRATGKAWVGLFQVAYSATAANEKDYDNNPANFSLDYYQADLAGTYDIWTARVAYEQLEGDGVRGFFTPLGTTHAFQGWADAFATAGGNKTHVDGIEDWNFTLVARPRFRSTYWFNTEVTVRYHDFNAERTGADLAHEWDVQLTAAITPKLSVLGKYADFDREESVPVGTTLAPADRTKFWLGLEYKL
jgi:hypothetical protein